MLYRNVADGIHRIEDANTNWYLSYRSSGEKGTELFFIIGDPNSLRFTEKVALKLVFAI